MILVGILQKTENSWGKKNSFCIWNDMYKSCSYIVAYQLISLGFSNLQRELRGDPVQEISSLEM